MLNKITAAIAVIIVASIAVAGILVWRGVIPLPAPLLALLAGARAPEYSARFYPPDTLAYGWLTLAPGQGQFNDMQDIWQRLNDYPAFADILDDWYDDFQDETGIDFQDEVVPWIGPEIAAAIIDFDPPADDTMPDDGLEYWAGFNAAITIGVRNQDAAAEFLLKWREYMERENEADFAAGDYRGYNTWTDDANYQAYALTPDWLVYATDEDTLHNILDRIDGGGNDSLAQSDRFIAARAALPERRFNSGYVDTLRVSELAGDAFGVTWGGIAGLAGQTPEWTAASAAWVPRGIVAELVSPAAGLSSLTPTPLDDPAVLLPDDTLGFAALSFDPDVDHWRAALAQYRLMDILPYPELLDEINAGLEGMSESGATLSDDATLADALNLGFDLAEEFTGIDLESDFLAHLAGRLLVAVREFNFDAMSEEPENTPVDATLMLSYREAGQDELAMTMQEITLLVEQFVFMPHEMVDVGAAADATVFPVDGTAYAPGYVMHDGYLTLGSTKSAMSAIVERQKGAGAVLSDSAEYQRAIGNLPNRPRQFLGYIDTRRIIDQIDADDWDLERDQYRILDEGIGVIAIGAAMPDAEYSRGAAVLTLFPE